MALFHLLIDTSTRVCSVCLSKDGKAWVEMIDAEPDYSHAEQLHAFILAVLSEAAISFHDLSAVAVAKGPGSYTGLRIGISAAKGICFALDIPLIAFETLDLLCASVKKSVPSHDAWLMPMVDARRREVYTSIISPEGLKVLNTSAVILDDNWVPPIDHIPKLYFFGDGAEKSLHIAQRFPAFQYIPEIIPKASYMAEMTQAAFEAGLFEDLAYFEPLYLKDFVTIPSKKNKLL